METLAPYLKYVLYLITIIGILWVNRNIIRDPELKTFFLDSLKQDGKPSSKYISAFIICMVLCVATLISIHYADRHTIPEFIFYGLLGLITSIWAIREVGRYTTLKMSPPQQGTTDRQQPVQQMQSQQEIQPQAQQEESGTDLIRRLMEVYNASKPDVDFKQWVNSLIDSDEKKQ